MATEILKSFLVSIGVVTDGASLNKLDKSMAGAENSIARLDAAAVATSETFATKLPTSINKSILMITAFSAAITYAYKKIFDLVESTAESFEKVSHLANRVNTTAEQILKLGYVAQFSRSSVEAAQASLDGLNRAAGEASLGVGRAKKIFNEIGLSVKDSNGHLKNTYDLMLELGDKIKGMERGKQIAILEKLGIDPTMIEVLTKDVSGLQNEFDSLYKSAGINANQAAESSEKFMESLNKLKFTIKTVSDVIGLAFMSKMQNAIDTFREWIMNNLPQIISTIKPIIKTILQVGDVMLQIAVIFGHVAAIIIGVIVKINNATNGWALKIGLVTLAWKKLNLAFLASPIGIILELIAALYLLWQDYQVFKQGGQSLINWNSKLAQSIVAIASVIETVSIDIIQGWSKAVDYFAISGKAIGNEIFDVVQKIKAAIADVEAALNDVETAYNKTVSVFDKTGSAIGGAAYNVTHFFSDKTPSIPTVANSSNNINQNTNIVVHGSTNPYETAQAVSNQQRRVNADLVRNTRGSAR